jgi:hypothetical protein
VSGEKDCLKHLRPLSAATFLLQDLTERRAAFTSFDRFEAFMDLIHEMLVVEGTE